MYFILRDFKKLIGFFGFSFLLYFIYHLNFSIQGQHFSYTITNIKLYIDYSMTMIGGIGLYHPICVLIGIVFLIWFAFLILKKYFITNPFIFVLLSTFILICILSPYKRFDFGLSFFIGSRYKIYGLLISILSLISFYDFFKSKIKRNHLVGFLAISILYYFGINYVVYKKCNQRNKLLNLSYISYKKGENIMVYTNDIEIKGIEVAQKDATRILRNLELVNLYEK